MRKYISGVQNARLIDSTPLADANAVVRAERIYGERQTIFILDLWPLRLKFWRHLCSIFHIYYGTVRKNFAGTSGLPCTAPTARSGRPCSSASASRQSELTQTCTEVQKAKRKGPLVGRRESFKILVISLLIVLSENSISMIESWQYFDPSTLS